AGMVRAMKDAATALRAPAGAIDIVGMGGAPRRSTAALNVSTMACFVASAAGATICKHGNVKASSTSGSFDLLAAIGLNYDVEPARLEEIIADVGLGFAFARTYHPSMRHVGPVRTQLGIPTVFNALGPLANPAGVTRQVVGVADVSLAGRMIEVLRATGSEASWVVTGHGPLDEIAIDGPTVVQELANGEISSFDIDPTALGIAPPGPDGLAGGDAEANKAIMDRMFAGETGSERDIVVVNAAAGLVIAGVATDLTDGVSKAESAIDSGAAAAKVVQLVDASR
ncbi:MAG: anthranilate phosphoribosyltransferase, partial [Acidimicrobiales bacterium]